jgi:NADPH2:quinone reductase
LIQERSLAKAYILDSPGGIEKLVISNLTLPELGDEDVLIRHSAIGISYEDIQVRRGVYNFGKFPIIPGAEGVGYVEKKGAKVSNIDIGERVAYLTPSIGGYATHRVMDQNYLIKIDSRYSDKLIAAALRKGTVAHYLVRRTYKVQAGDKVLIYGASGGIGSILVQLAKYFGAFVIGVVGKEEKAKYAKKFGCDHVIISEQEDIVAKTIEITKGEKVKVVYDLVGKGSLERSCEVLSQFGLLVHYGDCAGEVENFDVNLLGRNSGFYTRPRIGDYEQNRYELLLSTTEVLAGIEKEIIKLFLSEYKFEDIPKIHRLIEERKTVGSIIVTF